MTLSGDRIDFDKITQWKKLKDDLDSVDFTDPLGESTRKAKRNLLLTSFIAVLIAFGYVEINEFSGVGIAIKADGDAIKGIACIIVFYFILSFSFYMSSDYLSYKFRKQRALLKPYIEIIDHIYMRTIPALIANKENDIINQFQGFVDNYESALKNWSSNIREADALHKVRYFTRIGFLMLVEIAAPLALGLYAICMTFQGVPKIIHTIWGCTEALNLYALPWVG
ncbi:MAG: hypothetical protein PHT19_10370 [Methylococcus sp.]|nr:hypothetical protein [Methylococcus sp.]